MSDEDDSVEQLEILFAQSESLRSQVLQIIDLPLYPRDARCRTSALLCSLSLDHCDGALSLLAQGIFPSALVVHRAQFEAVLRGVWVLYGANDGQVGKLASHLDPISEQAAKSLPGAKEMMDVLANKAPAPAYDAIQEFSQYNLKALNSYVHAGIHPLRSHEEGMQPELVVQALKNINGVGVLAALQLAVLTRVPDLQAAVLAISEQHRDVLRFKDNE
ncbi:hypothetical protein [Stenotrophomonas sp. CFBP 13718]|uniref:DUF6988 family protein n=1 Tax=Stenotrophomonas sp. CFBP 13718 TaxID=2775304 RepID=UPI0017816BF6|nr:hypothetical protein [Stenotrophomonas sp. CFBP 13718]MBD8697041.1 hypothetical protein [Stenotrophomonas sp. CFBP 13718]